MNTLLTALVSKTLATAGRGLFEDWLVLLLIATRPQWPPDFIARLRAFADANDHTGPPRTTEVPAADPASNDERCCATPQQ